MQVSVVKTTEHKNIIIPAATAVGGADGLALRYTIPVYKPEMDYFMFNMFDSYKEDNVNSVKKDAVEKAEELLKSDKDNEVLKLFIKKAKAKTLKQLKEAKAAIKSAPQEVQEKVTDMINNLAAKMKASKSITVANIKNAAKQSRPYSHFILPGAALGALVGYAYNVVGTINED